MQEIKRVLTELQKHLKTCNLVTDPDILMRYKSDWLDDTDDPLAPIAVARPTTPQEVSDLLSACNKQGICIVPQGGRTGLTGGAVPTAGAIALSLEKLTNIESSDAAAGTLTVEAGVTLKQAQDAASEIGMQFALDIGSRDSCTVGGNISTNAGGNHVLKYGMARDLVLGLEVVLADGTIVSSMNTMLKNNAGFDLKQIFIGSEGTLGVITRAVLRLHETPAHRYSALCALPDFEAVLGVLRHIRKSLGTELSTFEIMWPEFYDFASKIQKLAPLPCKDHFYLLVEQETNGESSKFEAVLEQCLEDGLILDALVAQSSKDAQEFWALRDSSGSLRQHFWPHANFDVSIPVTRIDEFVNGIRVKLVRTWPEAKLIVFGHIADSNVHVVIQVEQKPFPTIAIDDLVYDIVGEFGGSISAEHGIGTLKKSYLGKSRSEIEISQMRRLKRIFDPNNILNPGKVIDMGERV